MFESVVVVEAGHRGVVLYVGAVENRVLEGIHFIIPFAEQVVQMEVRTLKLEANATAASNDLQEVQSTIVVVVIAVLVDFRFSNYQNSRQSSSHSHEHSSKQHNKP